MTQRSPRSLFRLSTLRGRFAAPAATLTTIAFLATFAPPRSARADNVESKDPGETPNFADATNGVMGGASDAGSTTKATKGRKAPVSARGGFTNSVQIQVPPGRLGMTPSLALNYDSSTAAESAVGTGWSWGPTPISRSTRQGFPKLQGANGSRSYDDSVASFTGPQGEIIPAPNGPVGVTGVLYMPMREGSAVRYEYRANASTGGTWVEYDPSGIKRYYGADPCLTARTARIRNELGTHAWLLLREEDSRGNSIQYAYHNDAAAQRPDKKLAQAMPILARVEWGSNGCVPSSTAPFAVVTTLEAKAQPNGPLNLLEGNTVLQDRLSKIDVQIDGVSQWSYTLGYTVSAETGKQLLTLVQRVGDGPERTTFSYSTGVPGGGPRFVEQAPLTQSGIDPLAFYVNSSRWLESADPWNPQRQTPEQAVQAIGHRGGTKFIDIDGNGTTDAIYHGAGIGTTATHLIWEESSLQVASPTGLGSWIPPALGSLSPGATQPNTGLPYFPRATQSNSYWNRSDFGVAALHDITDMDGDGDADGVALPISVDVVAGAGAGLLSPPPPHYEQYIPGQMPIRIFTNTARNSGVQLASEQVVPHWPVGADLAATVYATPNAGGPLHYTATPLSDLQIPILDLNADGKPDVVLLKHRNRRTQWDPGGAIAVPHSVMLRFYGNMVSPGQGEVVDTSLDGYVKSLVRTSHFVVLVDSDLLSRRYEPTRFVQLRTSPQQLKIPELPPATNMMFLSSIGGIPAPGFPTSGPLPPLGPDGNPQGPVPPVPASQQPWWRPVVDPLGDVYDPLIDIDRGGGGGPAENLLSGEYHFVPRAYLMRGDTTRTLISEPDENLSDFEKSLQHTLNNDSPDHCATIANCLYPGKPNFNSFFADLNGDGLPDLVSAVAPLRAPDPSAPGSTKTTCFNGHQVNLNRGYAFETRSSADPIAPVETLAHGWAVQTDPSAPLTAMANRDRLCNVTRPLIIDDLAVPPFPVAAMAQTDINGDGRIDFVLSFQPYNLAFGGGVDPLKQNVYVNTGRGFAAAPSTFNLPADVAIAIDLLWPGQSTAGGGTWPRAVLQDLSRFVDLDNDGLVDIVTAGRCARFNITETRCTPAKWYRNQGVIPDRLVRVDTIGGAWTTIDYVPPKADIVRIPNGGMHPPANAWVVKTITSAAGPTSVPATLDPFPKQEIRLSYDNFVKDVVSNEVVGFEKVTAEFVNWFGGLEAEHVRVTRTFDVQPQIADVNGALLPVRHPLKGALVSMVSESGGWTSTDLYEYRLEQLGWGARIRPKRERHGETSPSLTSAWTAEETTAFDALFGNPLVHVTGNFDGTSIAPPNQTRTTGYQYEDHTGTNWRIGLVTHEQTQGYSEDINGTVDTAHVLNDVVSTYDSTGALASKAHVNVRGANCGGLADDVVTYDYLPNGLLQHSRESAGPNDAYRRDVTFTYDAKNLYAASAQTSVGVMSGLTFTPGVTSLTVSFVTDLRHGKTTRSTDPNNATSVTSYDSRGRLLTRTGPDGTLLERTSYNDDYSTSLVGVLSTVTTDTAMTYQRFTHLDSDGHSLSVVEGAGTVAVPWARKSKSTLDGFGRVRRSFLPAFVASLSAGTLPASGPMVQTTYDGLDRTLAVTTADGRLTSTAYEPRQTTETNARGIVTRRGYDAFGELLSVSRNPGGSAGATSTHSFVRDGRGEILSVTDGDGSVRRIERDGGGRIRYVTLPTAPGHVPARFAMCHDLAGKLVHLESPAGRVVDLYHDELGRTLQSVATDLNGLTVQTTQIYDRSSPGGQGRLTNKTDESGDYTLQYDVYGRPSALRFAPSPRALAGATNVARSYSATFVYTPSGGLTSVTFGGLPAINAPGLTYARDVRGRPISVTAKQGTATTLLAASVTFDAADRVTGARYGNGLNGAWTFNALTDRLDKISYLDSSSAVVAAVSHIYDANDNLLEEDRQKQGYGGIYSKKIHGYDALDRLRTSDASYPTGNLSETYAFSPAGNILSAGTDTYTYASEVTAQAVSYLEDVAAQKHRSLSYDPDGYLATDRETHADGSSSTRSLAFDPAGCMRSITRQDLSATGTTTSSASDYTCGLDGRVVARASTRADGSTSRRIDFAGLAEIRPDEGVFLLRVPLHGSVAVEDARSLQTGARNVPLSGYIVSDARGSVLATTGFDSSAPGFTREAEYDAWGKRVANYSTLSAPRHGFAGAEPDDAVGTYSFGARTYDPTLRRWVSPDPLLVAAPALDEHVGESLNLYSYADGNPVKKTDITGFCPVCIGIGIAIVVVGMGQLWASDDAQRQREAHPEAEGNPLAAAMLSVEVVSGPVGGAVAAGAAGGGGVRALAQASGAAERAGAEQTAAKAATRNAAAKAEESTVAKTAKGGSGMTGQTREQLVRSKSSFEKAIAQHEQKLAEYKQNPLAHDNKGTLKNAATGEIRQKIFQGRIGELERQIAGQQANLRAVEEQLKKVGK
jgi:RHS repeat-associated protein